MTVHRRSLSTSHESPAPTNASKRVIAAPTMRIVQVGNAVLRDVAQTVNVEDIRTDAFRTLIATMVATMRDAPGVGLAAPQIGVPLQVFVMEDKAVAKTHDDEALFVQQVYD